MYVEKESHGMWRTANDHHHHGPVPTCMQEQTFGCPEKAEPNPRCRVRGVPLNTDGVIVVPLPIVGTFGYYPMFGHSAIRCMFAKTRDRTEARIEG